MSRERWHALAACRGVGVNVFYGPDKPRDDRWADDARAICERCLVRQPCLDDAIAWRESYGVRGGLTPKERRSLKRRGAA